MTINVAATSDAARDAVVVLREALASALRYAGHDPDCDMVIEYGHCHCDYTTLRSGWDDALADTATLAASRRAEIEQAVRDEIMKPPQAIGPSEPNPEERMRLAGREEYIRLQNELAEIRRESGFVDGEGVAGGVGDDGTSKPGEVPADVD